ncbi:M48 family metallopeptidase [Geobacter sp. DSM 9736]|uniref:tetratricopeptide repeat protein n=1 Tax=Geobacter sp. DSM 9736 TaxID=1277350 RepID=UPI000B5130A2|nr:hypothetical protein [Geobacter sp. DSM 9736]SNB45833.1 hypothetical protein SAMN06269301_1262 [Geobacter sp. DSM 9736]
MRVRFQLLLVSALVLAAYYPAIFAEFNQVDDIGMIRAIEHQDTLSLKSLFLPGYGNGLYYRPLLGLSFYLDKYFWGLNSSFMHLENILLHLLNALLVFFLSRELVARQEVGNTYIPLICALAFGLHPVNVESVSWVSGRTDPLALVFILTAAILLIRFRKTGSVRYVAASALALCCGFMSKESALGFLLGGALFIVAKVEEGGNARGNAVSKSLMVLAVAGAGVFFFFFRSSAFISNKSNIGLTLQYWEISPLYSFMLILRSFGFYLKKIFWPFPLNFAIVQIDPLYELMALPLVMLCIWILWRRSLLSAVFVAGVGLIIPSFVIAFGQIAWTPFSERYVYMASAFIVTAAVHAMHQLFERWEQQPRISPFNGILQLSVKNLSRPAPLARWKWAFVPLFCAALVGTAQRNLAWCSNLSLYADTVKKVPDFNEVRNMYGIALYRSGDIAGAEREMAIARSLYSFVYDEKFDLNYASVLREQKRYQECLEVLQKVVKKTKGKSILAYEELIHVHQGRLVECPPSQRQAVVASIMDASDRLYALEPSAEVHYMLGKIALSLQESGRALKYFAKASEKFEQGSPYKAFAIKLMKRAKISNV